MCGICGAYNFSGTPVDRELIDKMATLIQHRGPDGSGQFVSGPVGLGHRRLSIIDLSGGAQPIGNEDGSLQVVFNGEIYNFVELRKELKEKGHHFTTESDTEVIVHGYEQWGDDCVSRFNGIFAFALWDANRRRLLLARDHLGVKPLYYVKIEIRSFSLRRLRRFLPRRDAREKSTSNRLANCLRCATFLLRTRCSATSRSCRPRTAWLSMPAASPSSVTGIGCRRNRRT